MSNPIVIAYHLIWTAYGWWLPNDPRGSSSHTIRFDILSELGQLHHGRKIIQPASVEIRAFYESAKDWLRHELLTFDDACVASIADAFAAVIADQRYTCYACAIMPDHVHLLIRKHKHQAEEMIAHFQAASRLRLRADALRTMDHPIWGGPGWKVFLDHPDDVRRAIGYVNDNPRKARLPDQHWPFVKPYDGWPLHPGHSPNSPYARLLRQAGRYPY
ncbi:MAG: transposase [Phycisphaeraceae bacterium]